MKTSKTIIFAVLMVLTCVGFISCSDDDKNDEPQPANELIGTWLLDDRVEPELYTFYENGKVEQRVWWVGDPDDVDIDYGTYRYDELYGFLQLFWEDGDIVRCEVKIMGDRLYIYNSDNDQERPDILCRQK